MDTKKWTIMYYNAHGPQLLYQYEGIYRYPEDLEEWLFCNHLEDKGWKMYRAGIYYETNTIILFMTKEGA